KYSLRFANPSVQNPVQNQHVKRRSYRMGNTKSFSLSFLILLFLLSWTHALAQDPKPKPSGLLIVIFSKEKEHPFTLDAHKRAWNGFIPGIKGSTHGRLRAINEISVDEKT